MVYKNVEMPARDVETIYYNDRKSDSGVIIQKKTDAAIQKRSGSACIRI